MQCVIDIVYCSQKVQWPMHIGIFLEQGIFVLKEHAACRLTECNLLYIPLNQQLFLQGNTHVWEQYNTSFNEAKPNSHFFSITFVFKKGAVLLQKNNHKNKIKPEIKALFLQQ